MVQFKFVSVYDVPYCLAPGHSGMVFVKGGGTMPKYTLPEALELFIAAKKNGASRSGRPISESYEKQLRYQITRFYSNGCEQHPKSFFSAEWCVDEKERLRKALAMLDKNVSDRNKLLRYLRDFWDYCGNEQEDFYVDEHGEDIPDGLDMPEFKENPARKKKNKHYKVRKEDSRISACSQEESRAVLKWFRERNARIKSFTSLRDLVMVGLMYHSAIRPCEIVSLNRTNITEESLRSGAFPLLAGQSKMKEDDRYIVLPSPKSREYKELISYLQCLDTMFSGKNSEVPLFPLEDGARQQRDNLQNNVIKRLLRKDPDVVGKISPTWSIYLLRHEKITRLIQTNTSTAIVARIAGHKNVQTTMNYVHLTLRDIVAASRKADEVYHREIRRQAGRQHRMLQTA
ncbi:MAG TPA: hypothetical protein DCZ04_16060 [Syntrophorhabdus aromaticivorans]|nr:hypothetical protein [Syntrophorhabdus aromaticivorans]